MPFSRCTHQNHLDQMVCPPSFFQKYWHIVGQDVIAVLSVLNSGHMLHKMNFTHCINPKEK